MFHGDAALTAHPRGCWWTQASREKLVRLPSAYRQCTQGLPVSKAKHYFWSSRLGRAAKILHNNNKHFRFAHYFSSEHFMDICALGFTSSVGKVGAATQRQEKRDTGHCIFWPNLSQIGSHTKSQCLFSFIPMYLLPIAEMPHGSTVAVKQQWLTHASQKVFIWCWRHCQFFAPAI